MSIPLDRLYNFLQDITRRNDHIIIYRFSPHGSRKISDLKQFNRVDMQNNTAVDSKFIFFHDQEPLNFDLYTSPKMLEEILQSSNPSKKLLNILNPDLTDQCREFLSSVADQLNIRIATIEHGLWFKSVILVHSELRSSQLQRYQEQDFIGVYWWSHALIARDWFRYAEHDPALHLITPKTFDFLIYNRAWTGTREYRLKFIELLAQNKVLKNCLTWFNPVDQDCCYTKHDFENSNLKITNYQLHQLLEPSMVDATASADYCAEDYQKTSIEIVLETLFDDDRLHLTEKILRPIACGQPFMLAATPGSLAYLRSYGFKTFGDYINESYDDIEDPLQRLSAICQEMSRIMSLPPHEKLQLFDNMKQIALENRKVFFSSQWQQSIVNEFKQNFDQAFDMLKQKITYPI